MFANPLFRLTPQDLEGLLADKPVENIRLEFKRDMPKKDETLKKLSSFANTYGGFLIIGAEARSKDGRLLGFPGVDVSSGYKQTLVQWCFEKLSPPLQVDVSDPIPAPGSDGGKVCYVVYVAESDLAPHFLNGRKGIYVRTNEFSSRFDSQLATSAELQEMFQRRQIISNRRLDLLRRARQRFSVFTERRYSELTGRKESIGCRFDLCIAPRFPTQRLCDHAKLYSIVTTKRLSWRQVGFPRTSGGGFVSQHESVIGLRPGSSFSILEANVWGMVYYATEIERTSKGLDGIHLNHFLGQTLVFLSHASATLGEIGYSGPLTIEMRLEGLCGTPWLYFDVDRPAKGPSSELDDDVAFAIEATGDMLAKKRDSVAMDLLRYVFFATNWTDMADSPEKLERLVRSAYGYNMWKEPAKLLV
jgi:hypothetical protein